jgi:hypothetical protein
MEPGHSPGRFVTIRTTVTLFFTGTVIACAASPGRIWEKFLTHDSTKKIVCSGFFNLHAPVRKILGGERIGIGKGIFSGISWIQIFPEYDRSIEFISRLPKMIVLPG